MVGIVHRIKTAPVEVSHHGQFAVSVEFSFQREPDKHEYEAVKRRLGTELQRLSGWRVRVGKGFFLTARSLLTTGFVQPRLVGMLMRHIGLSQIPRDPVFYSCACALAHAYFGSKPERDVPKVVETVRSINGRASDSDSRKMIKFIEDRNYIETLGLAPDYVALENAINLLLPILAVSIEETQSGTPQANENMQRVFGNADAATRHSIVQKLSLAHQFLSEPKTSKFKLASQAPREYYLKNEARKDIFAFELLGTLYFFERRLVERGGAVLLQDTILHECLHVFVQEVFQRPNGRDPAYRHEENFFDLEAKVALSNPDSFVEYVRGF